MHQLVHILVHKHALCPVEPWEEVLWSLRPLQQFGSVVYHTATFGVSQEVKDITILSFFRHTAPTSTKINVVKWVCLAPASINSQQKDENHLRRFHFLRTWKTLVDKQRENQRRQTRQRGGDRRRKGDRVREFWWNGPAAAAAVSLTASRQHIHQAPTMLRERNHNLQ